MRSFFIVALIVFSSANLFAGESLVIEDFLKAFKDGKSLKCKHSKDEKMILVVNKSSHEVMRMGTTALFLHLEKDDPALSIITKDCEVVK